MAFRQKIYEKLQPVFDLYGIPKQSVLCGSDESVFMFLKEFQRAELIGIATKNIYSGSNPTAIRR